MSWGFYAQGKPSTVANKAIAEIDVKRCDGAEEIARIRVMEAINELCYAGCNSECAIKVEASGSAYTENGVQISNQLKLNFETISTTWIRNFVLLVHLALCSGVSALPLLLKS